MAHCVHNKSPTQALDFLISAFIRSEEKLCCLWMDIPSEIHGIIEKFYPQLLRKFEHFSEDQFQRKENGLEIRGTGNNCGGFLVYPETTYSDGYRTGVHFWSVKLVGELGVNSYCYRSIGVVSGIKRDIDLVKKVSDTWPTQWTEKEDISTYFYRGDEKELERGDDAWNGQDTITVKLDCDQGVLVFFRNGEEARSTEIKTDKSYFFAMTSCGNNNLEVVPTPQEIQ